MVILLILILFNALFAMSEIALIKSRRIKLRKKAAKGSSGAKSALRLIQEPTRFLSTVQIGITSISITSGIVGEAAFSEKLNHWLLSLHVPPHTAYLCSITLVVIFITYFSIVLGELVPKRLGQIKPELMAELIAKPMQWLATLAKPFVILLSFSTDTLLRLIGIKSNQQNSITAEDINDMLIEGSESGIIEEQEHRMARNIFQLDQRKLASLMVPHTDIIYLDTSFSLDKNLKIIQNTHYTRYPVCHKGLKNLLGVLNIRELLVPALSGQSFFLDKNLSPAVFVPESLTAMELLENSRVSNTEMIFVVDEYGEIQGMVCLQAILEAITGKLKRSQPEENPAIQRDDGSWLLDGFISTYDLKNCLGLKHLPQENKQHYHTLSGMLALLLGRLAHTGDKVEWENWQFEIVDLDEKTIDKVIAKRINQSIQT